MKLFAFSVILLLFSFTKEENSKSAENLICLSTEEEKLYKLIMTYREGKKLPIIPFSAKLTQVAQAHVRDLADNFDYDNKRGCNPHSWSKNGTWTSCCYTPDHKRKECMWDKPKEIAGYIGSGYEIAYYSSAGASAEEGLDGWKKSPGHNPLLINSGIWSKSTWKGLGIGIYKEYGVVWFGETEDPSELKICD
jgi:uncharacterized protein YkwD